MNDRLSAALTDNDETATRIIITLTYPGNLLARFGDLSVDALVDVIALSGDINKALPFALRGVVTGFPCVRERFHTLILLGYTHSTPITIFLEACAALGIRSILLAAACHGGQQKQHERNSNCVSH